MTSPTASSLFRPQREARVLWVLGLRVRLLAEAADSCGAYSLVEFYLPPSAQGVPPHVHEDCDELFHMLDGGLKMFMGEDRRALVLRSGDTLIVPRGTLHAFANPFLSECRFILQYTPGGFEQFFIEAGVPASDMFTPPDMPPPTLAQMRTLAKKHHMLLPGVTE